MRRFYKPSLPLFYLLLMLPVCSLQAASLVTTPAINRELPVWLTLDGVVEAENQATITAKTSGEIIELNFDVNDYVHKGDVLLRFKNQRNQAEIAQARASVAQAKAQLTEAQNSYDRSVQLLEKKVVSSAKMDQTESALKAAKAQLELANAGLTIALDKQEDHVVRSPYSGYMLKRHVDPGENAQAGQALFTGISLDALRVHVMVPQSRIAAVRRFNEMAIKLADGRQVTPKDITFFPYAHAASHAYGVRLHLPEGLDNLYPGALVRVQFVTGSKQRVLIPVPSVVTRSEVTAAYVVDGGGHVSLRHLRTGRTYADLIEVLAGLESGEQVAVDPVLAGQQARAQLPSMEAYHE
ncbi:efflux transporter, RND family, MFP subunit [Magnetococcus marinus MC-1]|uniref:Efflux transporter, RND family, MFP subunit n=1 Tax=Magnetococcus marinus (strain ATCC BAA-1437 / JCM 17883 / MC-1) TaxID=156889 RepID=A0L8N3_MAGMM|nr:efflux RND transporter periplasmic adaptor subunit [Magnetococcus marinus]ABK44326.1 efflux transporter, RND family, MFP subunit [Magnetococcus marinus MC-1]